MNVVYWLNMDQQNFEYVEVLEKIAPKVQDVVNKLASSQGPS